MDNLLGIPLELLGSGQKLYLGERINPTTPVGNNDQTAN